MDGSHPQLKGMVDVFSRELKRETGEGLVSLKVIYENRGERMTPDGLITEMTKAMYQRIRGNAGYN